jgi:hypothetical protein
MSIRHTTLLIFLYIPVSFFLLLYSFTQIDLGFNLANIPVLVTIQKAMQQIGYFNRPLSTFLYLALLAILYGYYAFFLSISKNKLLSVKNFWIVLIFSSLILTASYNAFSYDLFNYIFDAKILSHYGLNPYSYRAMDFPGDPMLGFMHWTHRTYPYGPVWLALTAPLYFLGFSNFLPTQMLFKLLIGGSFLGSVYFIGEILKKINSKNVLFGMVLFAFNPLVLIEATVSSHNDIVMMFFALASLYFLVSKKKIRSILFLVLSIGTKFATIFLLPVYIYHWYSERYKKAISWEKFFAYCMMMLAVALVLVSLRTTFQPWYLFYLLPLAPFLSERRIIIAPVFILTLAALLNYVPYLYIGNWNAPIPNILLSINIFAVILTAFTFLMQMRGIKRKHSV